MSTFNKYRLKGAFHWQWYETEDWYRWLVDRCVKFCSGVTLDLGCGDGLLLSKLPKGSYGIENDKDAIKLCERNNLSVIDLDIEGAFISVSPNLEYVACLNVIEHLNNPKVVKDYIKFARKGAVITTIDYQGGTLGEDHKFEWTYDEMMDFFKEFNPKGFRYKDTEWIGVEILKERTK